MKLRILNNSIRLRLSQLEIETLKSEKRVSGKTSFNTSDFVYSLIINSSEEDISTGFENGHLKVMISKSLGDTWINTELVGFENKDQGSLRIVIEKDFQCLHKRPGEDDTNSFPNPLAEVK
ncbi:hypothetical protein [Reichenbachiella sp. MALMAid0571]|uniref:DUF7009 family protein n=1 Tax=Reichenbachiella sp. MALMAid0571 TaxID=3143939 RepID=UPI0032DF6471